LSETNALAYYENPKITAVKFFIVQAPEQDLFPHKSFIQLPPACPCCLNLLQRRFIHHPETFKQVIKAPFEWGYGTNNGKVKAGKAPRLSA
jgi:hypothetical protein